MFDWKGWGMKLGMALGYNKGFPKGYTDGQKQGTLEARMLVLLMKQYGSFDAIPTAVIRKEMPAMGHVVANQQLIKRAVCRLRDLLEEMGMPPINVTIDMVIKFLESDPNLSDEDAAKIDAVLESTSVFGGLISLAEKEDYLDVELFMRKIREPLPNPHLNEYYACLKNDNFEVT
jgi:hypothetical protein